MDELALNVYRREGNAASLALKFLKGGCQNIHLYILKADFVKGTNAIASGRTFKTSIRLTRLPKLHAEAFTDKQIETEFQE